MNVALLQATLARLVKDPNLASNALGAILVGVGGASLDWAKVLAGDHSERLKLYSVMIAGALSYYIGKTKPPEPRPA
jgi:hypothetical protein